jgi:signal transduction histidine kinase
MKKTLSKLCLTIVVLLGSVGISESADFDKDAIALKNLVQRNDVYYKFLSSTPHTGKVLGQKTGYLKYGRWDGDYIEIEFQDNGVGFNPSSVEKIFKPFSRLDKSKSTPGSGLGLSIVKRIIEHHYGSINVCSEIGVGTRFNLKFLKQ